MYHLVCVHPFHHRELNKRFEKGEKVTDQQLVKILSQEREAHFVRVSAK